MYVMRMAAKRVPAPSLLPLWTLPPSSFDLEWKDGTKYDLFHVYLINADEHISMTSGATLKYVNAAANGILGILRP